MEQKKSVQWEYEKILSDDAGNVSRSAMTDYCDYSGGGIVVHGNFEDAMKSADRYASVRRLFHNHEFVPIERREG